jgi:hypothetical protein
MTIYVLPKWAKTDLPKFSAVYPFKFSPFTLGPVMLYSGMWAKNMENGWQYSKVYEEHQKSGTYWEWAQQGWDNPRAVRYPMGKGAKPMYSLWAGETLDYIQARKRIYIPLYSNAVRFYAYEQFKALRREAKKQDIAILDYDAYDHRALGYSWDDVINDPTRKMGHGFVLAMMIEGYL